MSERTPGLSTNAGVPVPLKAVEIAGEIVAPHVMLRVRQRYVNVEAKPIEAIYTFPLPAEAAVVGFAFESGGRRVEGVVREREEAFKQYDEALVQGHGAALLDQERDDVFTCAVGNVNPGEEAVIEIAIVARTERAGEALRLKIPTLVAPRYVPGAPMGHREGHGVAEPTDRVPDADRISPPISPSGEVEYRATLALAVHAGEGAEISSPSHAIVVTRDGAIARVSFAAGAGGAVALDRDLVLSIEAGERAPIEALVAHRAGDAPGFVALTQVPDLGARPAKASLSVVFLLDRSGSMGGDSIEEARRALRLCLRHLREGDRFSILAFDDSVESFAKEPVPLTAKTLAQADAWIAGVEARGGTELLAPLLEAAKLARDGVIVLLTDGQVGNEDEIAAAVVGDRGNPCQARIYSFGIGTNVSDALLRKLARATGGAIESIHPGERIDEKVVAVFARAIARRVRAVRVACDGVELDELTPMPDGALPDLVDGEPWTLFARYAKPGAGKLELRGTLEGEAWLQNVPVELPDAASTPAVPKLWARERVRDLEAQTLTGRRAESMKARIVALGVEHGLATRYTSFVAIELRSEDRKTRDAAQARPVPVNAPAGWAMFERPPVPQRQAMHMQMRASAMAYPPPAPGAMPFSPPFSAGAAPPMAMPPSPSPARAGSGGGAGAPLKKRAKRVLDSLREAFGGAPAPDSRPPSGAASSGYRAPITGAPPPPQDADLGTFETADARPIDAPKGGGDDPWSIVERQQLSGLWIDAAPGDRDGDARAARATVEALVRLLGGGVTSAHPLYGEPVRKAIEALLQLLPRIPDPALRTRALAVAWLAAEGKRTRRVVRAAIEALAPELAARLDDEAALKAEVAQG
jgi:Ca-activated chloride channel family protein